MGISEVPEALELNGGRDWVLFLWFYSEDGHTTPLMMQLKATTKLKFP